MKPSEIRRHAIKAAKLVAASRKLRGKTKRDYIKAVAKVTVLRLGN